MSKLHIIDHPMIQHKLTRIRDINTGAKDFRDLLKKIAISFPAGAESFAPQQKRGSSRSTDQTRFVEQGNCP